jgi:hypothetical protein
MKAHSFHIFSLDDFFPLFKDVAIHQKKIPGVLTLHLPKKIDAVKRFFESKSFTTCKVLKTVDCEFSSTYPKGEKSIKTKLKCWTYYNKIM